MRLPTTSPVRRARHSTPETAACEPVPTECVFVNASVVQTASDRTFLIPDGTIVPGGGFLIIGRDADQATFEANFGITLAPNVVYFNGENQWPSMNNDETFTLFNEGLPVDGPTAVPVSSAARNMQRVDTLLPASDPASWNVFADNSQASPGTVGPHDRERNRRPGYQRNQRSAGQRPVHFRVCGNLLRYACSGDLRQAVFEPIKTAAHWVAVFLCLQAIGKQG